MPKYKNIHFLFRMQFWNFATVFGPESLSKLIIYIVADVFVAAMQNIV